MSENDKVVEPGAPLAYSEEFLPGAGTYDDGEQIRAAVFGRERVDTNTMTLNVEPLGKSVAQVDKGDIVVGRITFLKPELASVQILEVRGKEGRSLLQQVEGTLHVSKVEKRYIKDLGNEFNVGDLIRAKVVGLRGGPQLATDNPDMGVIRAYSSQDMTQPLEQAGQKLRDPETGRTETRKTADDYGSGRV